MIENPESLDPNAEVLGEENAEVRRVKIERYGADRLMREVSAEKVNQDDVGILWRLPLKDDPEPILMAEVVNSTPEPDGSLKNYMIRVPPTVRTAREGIAWTFALKADEYQPAVEA